MSRELFYQLEAWQLALAVTSLLLAAAAAGFRFGVRSAAHLDEAARAELGTLQGAILSLLALLLGFSFAMSEARYETRKQLVLAESNAIGTTYLRAQLLPEPQRRETAQLIVAYVDARLAFHEAGSNRTRLLRASRAAERLQAQLWARGVAAAALDRRAVSTGLFLQSLNEVIDLHEARLVALENRVPGSILLLLLFVAIIACGLIGHGCGLGGNRHIVVTLMTVVVFVAVMLMIVDIDRPDRGLVRVSQQSMLRLRQSLSVPQR